jgi:uncharacterized protein (TIGR02246 family)
VNRGDAPITGAGLRPMSGTGAGSGVEAPADLPGAFVEAWNARDPDGIAELFAEDADFVNVVGIWWEDRGAIRRAHAYGLERIFPDSTLRLGRVKVRPVAAGVATVHARMTLEKQTGVGKVASPGRRVTLFSFVVHRSPGHEGRWICLSAHNTDVVPGAETHVRDEANDELRPVDYRG